MVLALHPLLAVLSFAALVGCSTGQSGAAGQDASELSVEDDRLGQGDVFEVRVFGEETLGGKYQVGADGAMDFPLLGRVDVLGKTPREVAEGLRVALQERGFLREPHVSVFVTESNSKRITVIGAVAKPGTFSVTPGLSLVQVISLAGGFSSLADRDRTVVTRRESDGLKRYQVPVDEVSRGTRGDFMMRPGDIVFVPERIF